MTHPNLPFRVFVFSVGQGDHILLHFPDGSYGLIDTYYDLKYNPAGEPPGLTYLKKRHKLGEVIRLRFLHISHYHEDHLKGIGQWLDWVKKYRIPVDYLLLPGNASTKSRIKDVIDVLLDENISPTIVRDNPDLIHKINKFRCSYAKNPILDLELYKECLNQQKAKNKKANFKPPAETEYLNAFKTIHLYKDKPPFLVYCIAPLSDIPINFSKQSTNSILRYLLDREKETPEALNKNDISTVLLFRYEQHTLVFGGDAEMLSLEASINKLSNKNIQKEIGGDFSSNFIKLFHHGSKQSSSSAISKAFLRVKSNVHIAISAGTHAKYNHPNTETINNLQQTAEEQETTLHFYATNHDHLQVRGNVPLAQVMESISLWKSPKRKKQQQRRKRKIALLNDGPQKNSSFLPQSDLVKQRNQFFQQSNNFIGYRFEFQKGEERVRVAKLVTG